MAHRIDHHGRFVSDAAAVYAVLCSQEFLRARLAALGGEQSSLECYDQSGGEVRHHSRHGIPAEVLPPAVRTLSGGSLTVDRRESWRVAGGEYLGEVGISIPGVPGELGGTQRIVHLEPGSDLVAQGTISVPVPVLGGKIEESVLGYITELLDAEYEFTRDWLGEGR
jgi:hypothetical protein